MIFYRFVVLFVVFHLCAPNSLWASRGDDGSGDDGAAMPRGEVQDSDKLTPRPGLSLSLPTHLSGQYLFDLIQRTYYQQLAEQSQDPERQRTLTDRAVRHFRRATRKLYAFLDAWQQEDIHLNGAVANLYGALGESFDQVNHQKTPLRTNGDKAVIDYLRWNAATLRGDRQNATVHAGQCARHFHAWAQESLKWPGLSEVRRQGLQYVMGRPDLSPFPLLKRRVDKASGAGQVPQSLGPLAINGQQGLQPGALETPISHRAILPHQMPFLGEVTQTLSPCHPGQRDLKQEAEGCDDGQNIDGIPEKNIGPNGDAVGDCSSYVPSPADPVYPYSVYNQYYPAGFGAFDPAYGPVYLYWHPVGASQGTGLYPVYGPVDFRGSVQYPQPFIYPGGQYGFIHPHGPFPYFGPGHG